MATFHRTILITIVVSSLLASGQPRAEVHEPAENDIPERRITDLQEELVATEDIESTTQRRRICKNIVRSAESLLDKYADSPDRFRVLGIVFETQKILFSMRPADEYREAILETAGQLLEAPDEHAAMRVEADMLLLQLELSKNESPPDDSALEIARFADRYRDTPAEARSLMMASSATFDLGNSILLDALRKTLSKRFAHDPLVTAFMRERFAASSDACLRGDFERADGKLVSFPIGQIYLVCFWSLDAPLLKEKIAEIKALQDRGKGQLKVFSFNLDELPDGGKGALKRMKIDWIPMLLPGGTENPTYLSVGGANLFSALVVDAHGLTSIHGNAV